ncbi:MAG: glycosyl hydrolase family 18 protein [Defluviitaleaceae bacterium]|nr:glycosyl hydrolase family 18 protein [Defluviitaleaceae bacterium]
MKNFQKSLVTIFISVLVIAGVAVFVAQILWPRLREVPAIRDILPNTSVVDFHTHFSLDPDVTQLVFDGQRLRDITEPLVEYRRGIPHVYLSVDFLREHIDPFIFWDKNAGVLFVSTLYEMLEFTPDSDVFLINGSSRPLDWAIIERDGEIFMPADLIQRLYPLEIEHGLMYNFAIITSLDVQQTTAVISSNRTDVRYLPSDRAAITAQLERGEEVLLFLGDSVYDFVRVRTAHGLLGYVQISEIEGLTTATPLDYLNRATILDGFIDNFSHHPKIWSGGTINLIWEFVYHPDANRINMETDFHSSLTVVSPTWFRIDGEGTHLNSVASREYVDWAHSQGVNVWPLVFDVGYERSRLFLTDRNTRQHAINQLIEYVDYLNLDGINIDFEHLTANEGPYKIQFLRELAIPMRQRGIVLSAAVKVPIPATAFYRRDLIGKTVDFVMVMTYDEHWTTSPVAGPNASLPWVRRGVENMLLEVPSDRLLMGLPFYNRIWREVLSTGEVSNYRNLGTNSTRAFFEERGVQWIWDFEIGSYFGEVPAFEDGETVIYRVWLEDARSIQEKMHIFDDYNLAGVAIWSRLFSIPEFWDVLELYF